MLRTIEGLVRRWGLVEVKWGVWSGMEQLAICFLSLEGPE